MVLPQGARTAPSSPERGLFCPPVLSRSTSASNGSAITLRRNGGALRLAAVPAFGRRSDVTARFAEWKKCGIMPYIRDFALQTRAIQRKPGGSRSVAAMLVVMPDDAQADDSSDPYSNRFSGLCIVLHDQSPSAVSTPMKNCRKEFQSLVPGRRLLFLLTWRLQVICMHIPQFLHTDFVDGDSAIVWLRGRLENRGRVPVEAICSSRVVEGHRISVEIPDVIESVPVLEPAHESSVEFIIEKSEFESKVIAFLLGEVSRKLRRQNGNVSTNAADITPDVDWKWRDTFPESMQNTPSPAVRKLGPKELQALAIDEDGLTEDVSDRSYSQRHKPLEAAEASSRRQVREQSSERWAVCDVKSCRKWRLLPRDLRLRPGDQFYCGMELEHNSWPHPNKYRCAALDDWLIHCIGREGAQVCEQLGIHTVEGLKTDTDRCRKLQGVGLYYDADTESIKAYS